MNLLNEAMGGLGAALLPAAAALLLEELTLGFRRWQAERRCHEVVSQKARSFY